MNVTEEETESFEAQGWDKEGDNRVLKVVRKFDLPHQWDLLASTN